MGKPSRSADCADILRALGDATRLGVLQALLERPYHVGDLQERFGVEQSLLSHHLKVLREAGLVLATRDGKAVLYKVAPEIAGAREKQCIDLKCCQVVFRPAQKQRTR
jgi:ArsR family transcriptional regulator, nickel/cobalt-responsive transcriptional repressor